MTRAVCGACRRDTRPDRLHVLVDQGGQGGRIIALCPACSPRYDRSHQHEPTRWPPVGLTASAAARMTLAEWMSHLDTIDTGGVPA
ncbi:hypothetical protein ACFQH6_19340 [Halobacteriaceae archaeon GCM10025711]